jgi:hypothetical protein
MLLWVLAMAKQEETARLMTWFRMELVQVHAVMAAPGRAETDFRVEQITMVLIVLAEGVAALGEQGV